MRNRDWMLTAVAKATPAFLTALQTRSADWRALYRELDAGAVWNGYHGVLVSHSDIATLDGDTMAWLSRQGITVNRWYHDESFVRLEATAAAVAVSL